MELNYKVFGSGDPIIILHGMFGMLDNWQTIAKKLSDNFMVFLIDLRNHGRSPHADAFSYAIMAEDLRAFMESNWIYKAHIVGHSMGGKVAMQFAMENEDMVDKLIVVDIAPKNYKGNHQTIFKALLNLHPERLNSRKEASDKLAVMIEDAAIRQFILKNLYLHKETGRYTWRMNLDVIHAAYQHILSNNLPNGTFEGATLFVRGALSDYIVPDEWNNYTDYFPAANLQTIDDAGHWVHAAQPAAFLKIIADFLVD